MKYSEETIFVADYIKSNWDRIVEETGHSVEEDGLRVNVVSKSVFLTWAMDKLRKNAILEIPELVKYPDMSYYNKVSHEVKLYINNKSKAFSFVVQLFSFDDDTKKTISFDNYGVFVVLDDIERTFRSSTIETIKLKLSAIDAILKHEIGHILVLRELYDHLHVDDFITSINNLIDIKDEQIREWDLNSIDTYHYHRLVEENMANAAVGLSLGEITTANLILSRECDFVEARDRNLNREGSKTQKQKRNKKKKKHGGNSNVNNGSVEEDHKS